MVSRIPGVRWVDREYISKGNFGRTDNLVTSRMDHRGMLAVLYGLCLLWKLPEEREGGRTSWRILRLKLNIAEGVEEGIGKSLPDRRWAGPWQVLRPCRNSG